MKKSTLNEIMGKSGGAKASERKLTLDDLGTLLGEKMPRLEFHPVGRLRLTTALRNRFGDSYKNLPGISDIMKEFDNNADFEVKVQKMKMIRPQTRK
jgi:hypothetical protein